MALTDQELRNVLSQCSKIGPTPEPTIQRDALSDLRRGRPPRRPPSRIALVERNGFVFWEWGPISSPGRRPGGPMRRAARRGDPSRKVIFSDELPPLGVNQIGQLLLDFDRWRNPQIDVKSGWKLRQWDGATEKLGDTKPPPQAGKLLVIVHGTASSAEHIVSEIKLAVGGPKLLADAAKAYQAVLAFEHPTVAFSPVLNAMDLATALAPYGTCDVDIICHSRGGLVSSWWMHMVDRRARNKRCIFVGAPLQGTSLANPAKLRGSLHLLANYGRLLGDVGDATGFLTLPMTIIKVVASVVDVTASVPLLDAALAMIPGLNAQSRIANNPELARLNQYKSLQTPPPVRFYIRANFNSQDPGWKIWRYVTDDPLLRAADAVVDLFVFSGKNDLVVDTDAMIDAVGGTQYTFDGDDVRVHHTNYFRQKETVERIREWLAIPG